MSKHRLSVRGTTLLLPAVAAGLLLVAAPAAQATGGPANDSFAQAKVLSAGAGSVTASNVGATTENGEAHVMGIAPAASVWFSWTPTVSGRVVFRTEGSSFDTVLAAVVGPSASSFLVEDADDDATFAGTFTHQSRIAFDAKAGTTYHVVVDGYTSADTGTIDLSWTTNDSFAAPMALSSPVSGSSVVAVGSNDGATVEPNEPVIDSPGGASVWFTWTAPFTGTAEFDDAWSGFGAMIGAYTGSSLATLTPVQVGDGSVVFHALAGQVYRIVVDGSPNGNLPNAGAFGLRYQELEPLVSVTGSSITEGNSGTHALPFTLKLSAANPAPVTVSYTSAGSTAKVGSDYVGTWGTVTFAPGQTTQTINVMVIGDTVKEADETMLLKLTGILTNNALFSNSQATGTIKNDD